MKRRRMTPEEVREWLTDAYFHPKENWYAPIFDVRRRALLYLSSRELALVDEPDLKITPALDRLFRRLKRRDPTLRVLPQMDEEARLRVVLAFITAQPEPDVRDALLARLAKWTWIVFGWRPGDLQKLTGGLPLDPERESALSADYEAHLRQAAKVHVDIAMITHGLADREVYSAWF